MPGSGGAPLVADLGQLRAAAVHIASFGNEVTECLDDIDRAMAALRATWHGEASEAQAESHRLWTEGAKQMQEALTQLQKIVDTARTNYADAVANNSEMWP
ncbi:WXG100 family type VII secretion target [Mycobacterium hippophais]|uniref:WXG100 family type VII secretion target n=1 Tax=Mycobacterium hippophais TaxID=3016340 RepID=UPI0038CDB6F4